MDLYLATWSAVKEITSLANSITNSFEKELKNTGINKRNYNKKY